MDLSAKYEELGLIGGQDVRVSRGRGRADGRSVLLHQFNSNPDLLKLALEYLLTQPIAPRLLDIGEYGSASCLVTVHDPELLDVEIWLHAQLRSNALAPPTTTSTTIPASDERPMAPTRIPPPSVSQDPAPGEFTRLFTGGMESSAPARPAPPPSGRRQPEAERSAAPGEFTSLFGGGPRSGGAQDSYSPPADPLYGGPVSAVPITPSAPRKPTAGEFTRLFGADSPADAGPLVKPPTPSANFSPSPPPAPRPPAAPPVPRGPSEYTRVMQGPAPADMPAAPAADASGQTPAAPAMPSLPAAPRVPSMPLTSSPSMPSVNISATPPPIPRAPSAPSASIPAPSALRHGATHPPAGRPNWTPYIVLFGALVVAALLLILILALRR